LLPLGATGIEVMVGSPDLSW